MRLKPSNCEKFVENSERFLRLHEIKSKDIDRVSHRYSCNLRMTQVQFSLACRELKINRNDEKINSFFLMFHNHTEDTYCVKKLALLGILLGNGIFSEKLMLLFQNYDTDSSRSLGKEEVKLMLKDITTICFHFIPSFARSLYRGDNVEYLDEYKKELMCMKVSLVHYFMSIFFESGNEQLGYEGFCTIFNSGNVSVLLDPTSLRVYCKEMLRVVQKTAEIVQEYIKDPGKLNTEMSRRLGISIPNIKNKNNIE